MKEKISEPKGGGCREGGSGVWDVGCGQVQSLKDLIATLTSVRSKESLLGSLIS